MLEIKDLTKKYNSRIILDNINFTFKDNKIYGIIGKNGAGKTTFLNILDQNIKSDGGDVLLDKNKILESDVSLVPTTPNVPLFLTGREFLEFYLEINKKRIKNMKSVCEYFEMVNISLEDQDKIMKEYSTGMKSKMQTLVNIISDKKVLLLDEPFTSLDILVQEQMKKLLREIKKNKIIVITTHILEIAIELCDEIIILKDGKFNLIEKKDLNDNEYGRPNQTIQHHHPTPSLGAVYHLARDVVHHQLCPVPCCRSRQHHLQDAFRGTWRCDDLHHAL